MHIANCSMYNHTMSLNSFEIRLCDSCGLRYPFTAGHPHGTRCPACMGYTRVILSRELILEPKPVRPDFIHPKKANNKLAVVLDNIRSAWNVGSILRSADGFGFDHAYFCGISPTPENEAVTKTSLGAEKSVAWSYQKDAVKLVDELRNDDWKVLALEEDSRAKELKKDLHVKQENQNRLLIVGNENTGVDPELLDMCHEIYYIPMSGEKKSFNVAIAFGVAAFALTT